MADKTVVHLLRHGEVYNPQHVLYGRLPNFHLSENGRLMADAAADFFAERDVVALFASPLDRAQETAQPLADCKGLPIQTDRGLIESGNVLEGKTITLSRLALNPVNWRYLWNPFTPSWGEPYKQVASRVWQVVERGRDAARGHEAVCVSHQLPIWVTRLSAENKRLWHNPNTRECALGSVTSFTFDGGTLTGVSYAVPPRRQLHDAGAAQ
ncbi:MAG TPA: histidine phosphatase family protein [Trebonia sp.]|nr:histidine phosphatase family protein [Trebonia sp.]